MTETKQTAQGELPLKSAPMTAADAASFVLRLKVAWPNADAKLDEVTIEGRDRLYLAEFLTLRPAVAELAVQELIRTSEFFPTIAAIRAQYDAFDRPTAQPPCKQLAAARASAERVHAAFAAKQAILDCEHTVIRQSGKPLPPGHPCERQCVKAAEYFAKFGEAR